MRKSKKRTNIVKEMVQEDYVSFETAKLLKEKGFDESCYQKYDCDGDLSFNHVGYINGEKPCDDFCALAPTQQLVLRWLREKYNIIIIIYPFSRNDTSVNSILYTCDIASLKSSFKLGHIRSTWDNYEKAVEDAIIYSLKYLI